jgi:hypothetical protein
MNRTNPQAATSSGWNYLSLGPYSGDSLRRHKERCHICRHPQREEIEEDFLDWTSPREIAETYGIASYRAIYRHATALGLFDRRRANIQRVTDRIIERIDETKITAAAIVAAIRVTLNEERKWLDCVHRLIHQDIRGEQMPAPPPDRLGRPIPREYLVGLAPDEIESLRRPQPSQKASVDRSAAEKSASEIAPIKPADSSLVASAARKAARKSEPPKPAPEKSSPASAPNPAPAPKPSRPSEPEPGTRLGNAPGQVAGLPWPWPAKKIQFARRRPWYSIRDG